MKIWMLLPALMFSCALAQLPVTARDGDWSRQLEALRNTPEAEAMIRIGDIDNLGFGFPENFDPFCERSTDAHYFPWQPVEGDVPGTDRILLGTSVKDFDHFPCYSDGYSNELSPETRPRELVLPLASLKGMVIRNAYLQLFLDDFQSEGLCSKFQFTLNGKRFAEAENTLASLRQTGPIGKLVTIPVSVTLLDQLNGESLSVLIDDPTTQAGDGFAIDFVKLIVNLKEVYCMSEARGVVLDRETEQPIAGASVEIRGFGQAITNAKGEFMIDHLPPGLHPAEAFATGYNRGTASCDVWNTGNEPVTIYLDRANKSATYNGKALREGESISIYDIRFDLGSAAIRPDARVELEKIFAFLTTNAASQIELSGHTSSDGDDASNKSLSLKRVQSCKEYLVAKGIDDARILTAGFGEERPIAPNDSEPNRAKNRRVEMRVLRL